MNGLHLFKRTTRMIIFCAAVLLGLVLARKAPLISGWYVALAAVVTLLSYRHARILSVYIIFIFGLSLGWWRGGIYMGHVRELAQLSRAKVVVSGTALIDSVYDDKSQLSFTMGALELNEPSPKPLVGKIEVSGYGEAMVYRGDRVTVSGKFYPGRGSVVAYLSYANMHITGHSHSYVYDITRRFGAGLQNALPEPLASFAMGILVGQRNTLPKDITAILSAVGLSHIIAVSGYNLTIMIRAGRGIFGKRSKFQTFVGSEALILGFLLVTGMSASIVRAALISSLSLGAWYYGRTIKPLLIILLAAALTALWNPLYIWSDIGWYLSFLAFFGVMILGPVVQKRFFEEKPRGLVGELVMETLAAQVMTLPIVLYIFKTTSIMAVPANVLVVPLIPLAMLLSFVAGLAGMFIAPLAGWVAWPARILLTYLIDMATMFSRVPHMALRVSLSAVGVAIVYAALILTLIVLWRKNQQSAKITHHQNLGASQSDYRLLRPGFDDGQAG